MERAIEKIIGRERLVEALLKADKEKVEPVIYTKGGFA